MSIIEAIKNGARFRHSTSVNPIEHHIMRNGRLVVVWEDEPNRIESYNENEANMSIELIPEEETLWVAIPKNADTYARNEENANRIGDTLYGPGNYTIHSITRTK